MSDSERPESPIAAPIDFVDDNEQVNDFEDDVAKLKKSKKSVNDYSDIEDNVDVNPNDDSELRDLDDEEQNEDEASKKKREFDERFDKLMKKPVKKRKNNDVDLEAMQDEAIAALKNQMKQAAYEDIECINEKKPATNKLKLLPQVRDTLIKSNLYDSILDNNMLEAVRIWLEPLPDASLPSYEIQKTLLNELTKLPIKTIHLRESGLGKVMIFYQQSKMVDNSLKRIAEKLIGDWTRPIMGRSDNYRAKKVPTLQFDHERFKTKTKVQSQSQSGVKKPSKRSLYQESADRRKRAAAPEARTRAYTVAPRVDMASLQAQVAMRGGRDERFKEIGKKLTALSQKKKKTNKGGPSIEGRGLNTM